MSGDGSLKPASSRDYAFALHLYLTGMQPLTAELMAWDPEKQIESFARNWNPTNTRIIFIGSRRVGWIQIDETSSEVVLQQLFVASDHQRRGIASRVLKLLVPAWNASGKPVNLTVLRNNPARRLYERFGFAVTGTDGVKLRMSRT